ncbi:MAG: diguanylate cyclase [Lachnospiraceae bacterium]|nr:diguanylate cyclase [Lachnospiraceae bacterium]
MKSIQTKIVSLVIMGIIVSTVLIGGIGTIWVQRAMNRDSATIMNLTCGEKAQELNGILGRMEQSVEILSEYTINNLDSVSKLTNDEEYREEYTQDLSDLGLTIAKETQGAVAIYVRFNPDITTSKSGFFWVKDKKSGRFVETELTDFDKYDSEDIEHVGWYYTPIQSGKALWLQPYYNENIDVYMISYVIPVYKDDTLIGIVGMDIDFNYIMGEVDSIQVYDTGYAFLTDENSNIIYSKYDIEGAIVSTDEVKISEQPLRNGMHLAVTAPISEINRTSNYLVVSIIVLTILIMLIFIVITTVIAKTIVRPLKELTVAANEIANGNLDISFDCKSKDEVGILSDSLKETAKQLKIKIEYIRSLAYIDKLTGVKNNTAYLHDVMVINDTLKEKEEKFAVFVVDINGLKQINDTYGHGCGNDLIIATATLLVELFQNEHVYRIGGDEFAVIMKDVDAQMCRELIHAFVEKQGNTVGNIKVSAAIGSAVCDSDPDYDSVFHRADGEMYEMKQKMKEQGDTSVVVG